MNGSIVRPNTWDETKQGVGVGSALLCVLCEASGVSSLRREFPLPLLSLTIKFLSNIILLSVIINAALATLLKMEKVDTHEIFLVW